MKSTPLKISLLALLFTHTPDRAFSLTTVQQGPGIEVVFSGNFRGTGVVSANRNSQIVASYDTQAGDGIYFYGQGLSANYTTVGTRYIGSVPFSNWGAAFYDNGRAIAVAQLGLPPEEVFREPQGNPSEPAINDQGQVAFFSRMTNGTGLRDAYLREPDGTLITLPDLGENSISDEVAMIDGAGRVIARHQFSTPSFAVDVYRYSVGLGWENLTTGRLPEGVSVSTSVAIQGVRPVSRDGDFVFQGLTGQPDGTRDPGVFLWNDDQQEVTFVFDNASMFGSSGGAFSLIAAPTFSDDNDLWIEAYRGGPLPEFRTLYRKGDGTIIDVEGMLPEGQSLLRNTSMNYDGDLWLATVNDSSGTFSYFLMQDGRLVPIITDTTMRIEQPVLTNSHEVFFWQSDGNGDASVIRLITNIPEPSTSGLVLLAVLLFQAHRSIVRCRRTF